MGDSAMTPRAILESALNKARLTPNEYDQAQAALTVMVRRLHRLEGVVRAIQGACSDVAKPVPTISNSHDNTVVEDIENTPTSYASGYGRRAR